MHNLEGNHAQEQGLDHARGYHLDFGFLVSALEAIENPWESDSHCLLVVEQTQAVRDVLDQVRVGSHSDSRF